MYGSDSIAVAEITAFMLGKSLMKSKSSAAFELLTRIISSKFSFRYDRISSSVLSGSRYVLALSSSEDAWLYMDLGMSLPSPATLLRKYTGTVPFTESITDPFSRSTESGTSLILKSSTSPYDIEPLPSP